MAVRLFPTDRVLRDNAFLELGFELGSNRREDYVPRLDVAQAVAKLRSMPALAARFLQMTQGEGDIYWAGEASANHVEGGSIGVTVVRRRDGEEAQGDNVYGKFLQKVRTQLRRSLSEDFIEEVPVREGQVVSDFTRKGAFLSDIEERERGGERFIHVDVYKPARFRFDTALDGTTGHAGRSSDNEVPFHRFVCPFGTAYPSAVIVGSAAEASILYEQALRGELDWKALFNSLKERNLLDSKLTGKQVDNLIKDYRAQFEWMRDEIVQNASLREMTIVSGSNMVPDASMGRSVYDAKEAPSPAHVLARYINNPMLLFVGGENGVMRSLGMLDKHEPERFSMEAGENELSILVAGSDTIGGRQPGRKATSKLVRRETVDADGRKVIKAEKTFEVPMKGREETEADYTAFAQRMDTILSGIGEGNRVVLVTGNVSNMGATVGVGTPRMVERYVRERGGTIGQYDLTSGGIKDRTPEKREKSNDRLSVVLMEHFAECLPVLVGQETRVDFRLNPNDEDSEVSFEGVDGWRKPGAVVCFSSSEDTNVRNVLSVGSLAVDSGLPVVHVQEVRSEQAQREALSQGAAMSRSGLFIDAPAPADLFRGELRREWDFAQANHLSVGDEATGLVFPVAAQKYTYPVLVEGQPFKSPLGVYIALAHAEMFRGVDSLPERLKAISDAEGSSTELVKIYNEFLGGRTVSDVLGDNLQERLLREAVRRTADANVSFMQSLLDLDGREIVMSSSAGATELFVDPAGKGENRFGLAMAAERDAIKALRQAREMAENEERAKLLEDAAKRQKIATGSRAEGQKVEGGLPRNMAEAKDAVWFIGTHEPLGLNLPEGEESFQMWDDMNGEDPLVREKVARPSVSDGEGGEEPNNYIYLFPTDLGSVTGRTRVQNYPDSRNLTGVTRTNPETGEQYVAAYGIPVRYNNKGYELMNAEGMPCSYRLDDCSSEFAASIVVADSRARSTAIRQGCGLILPGRERLDGTSYYTLGQVFMPMVWSNKEKKMVPNPHQAPLNLALTESYISLLDSGKKYPLNCIHMPRSVYHTQDEAVLKAKINEGKRFVSAEGRFIADLTMSLQIANATALALGVPLRFPLDKEGRIDLGPGVPEQYRLMAEKRIDSFIGVKQAQQAIDGKLPYLERIQLWETSSVKDLLVKVGTNLYMKPNDLAVAFGRYDFSPLLSGTPASLHEMAFRMEDGTVFTVKDAKTTRGVKAEDINKCLSYTKKGEACFNIRTTDPDKVPQFISLLNAYAERAKAVKVEARLVTEAELPGAGLEGYVNLLSSNSDEFAMSEHDIGREMTIHNATSRVRQEVEKDSTGKATGKVFDIEEKERNVLGEKTSGVYFGKVDAKDGFKGYVQIRYTLPNGAESGWRTVTNLELAKDTVMSLVSRTYRSDEYFVPSPAVMEMLWKAQAVAFAGADFRDFEWSAKHKEVVVDDKKVSIERFDTDETKSGVGQVKDESSVEKGRLFVSYYGSKDIPEDAYLVQIATSAPGGMVMDEVLDCLKPDFRTMVGPHKDGKIDDAEYTRRYREQVLDNRKDEILFAVAKVQEKAAAEGKDAYLLCYCSPGDFCHRYLVKDFLNANGIACEENPADRLLYQTENVIDEFKGENRFLSNFWPCKVVYEGETYPSVENAYQAAKCSEPKEREQFRTLSAGGAKQAGKSVSLRADWELVKDDIMYDLVSQKFRDEKLREMLLATGADKIIEGNTWGDTYWGVDLRTGKGDNRLGEILMKVRGEVAEMGAEVSEGVVSSNEKGVITYTESSGGYQQRTRENANADDIDFTLALAIDLETYGERATRKAAGDSYIGIELKDLSAKSVTAAVKEFLAQLPDEYLKGEPLALNIAGNGVYTLNAHGADQDDCDQFMARFFAAIESKGVKLEFVRSGGQTGFDEAGIAAAVAFGIPCECHAPKGWVFRDATGKDTYDRSAFQARFEKKDYGKLESVRKSKVRKLKNSIV